MSTCETPHVGSPRSDQPYKPGGDVITLHGETLPDFDEFGSNVSMNDFATKLQDMSQEIVNLKARVATLEESQKRPKLDKDHVEMDPPQNFGQSHSPSQHSLASRQSSRDDLLKAKKELEQVHAIRFKSSIWDACIILNLGVLGKRSLLLMVFCYLTTITFQGFFIYSVSKADTDYNEQMVNDIRLWRVKYGHDVDYASTDSDRPLASLVCQESGRASEIAAGRQMDILEEIQRYQSDGGFFLSLLAVSLWSFCCLKELLELMFFQYGITAAAIETWERFGNDACTGLRMNEQRNFELTTITWHRALSLGVLVTLPRLIILMSLGLYGIRFLMAISDLDEIILNAIALEVVLSVDELIFEALAPAVVQEWVTGVEVLRVQKSKAVIAILPLARFIFVFGVLFTTVVVYSLPLLNNMDQVEFEMCDGYVDFVTRQDLSKQYTMWVGHTSDVGTTQVPLGNELKLFRHQGVLQATVLECHIQNQRMGATVCRDRREFLPGSATQFVNAADIFNVPSFYVVDPTKQVRVGVWRGQVWVGVRERAEEAYCYDFDVDPMTSNAQKSSIRMALREQLRDLNLDPESCADVQRFCRKAAHWSSQLNLGNFVRLACPVTCGCDDPALGLLHGHEMYGCPSVCKFKYEQRLQEQSCVDRPDGAASLVEYQESYMELFHYDNVIEKYTAEGMPIPVSCDTWAKSSNKLHTSNWSVGAVSACDANSAVVFWEHGLRSIRPQCPVTCGCLANPEGAECPGSCTKRKQNIG